MKSKFISKKLNTLLKGEPLSKKEKESIEEKLSLIQLTLTQLRKQGKEVNLETLEFRRIRDSFKLLCVQPTHTKITILKSNINTLNSQLLKVDKKKDISLKKQYYQQEKQVKF